MSLEKNFQASLLKINQLNSSLTTTTHSKETQFTENYTHTHTDNYTVKEEELYNNNKLFESEGLRERKSANNEEEEEE